MKKHLAAMGLIAVGVLAGFQSGAMRTESPKSTSTSIISSFDSQLRQDTIPRSDTAKHHKMKSKMKVKKDSTWRKDSIPQ